MTKELVDILLEKTIGLARTIKERTWFCECVSTTPKQAESRAYLDLARLFKSMGNMQRANEFVNEITDLWIKEKAIKEISTGRQVERISRPYKADEVIKLIKEGKIQDGIKIWESQVNDKSSLLRISHQPRAIVSGYCAIIQELIKY